MDVTTMATVSAASSHGVSGRRGRRVRRAVRHNPQLGDFGGNVFKNIGKAVKKAATQTVHTVGKVLDNKVVKGLTAVALTATGVGAPAAAALMAAQGAAGGAMKKGGGLKKSLKGAAVGAATGAAAGLAGKAVTKIPKLGAKILQFRQKIGTAAKPLAPSYDSDKRLDALASGQLPEPTLIASTNPTMPVLQQIPVIPTPPTGGIDALDTTRLSSEQKTGIRARKAASDRTTNAKQRTSIIDTIKDAATSDIGKRAARAAAALLTPPSPSGMVPEGGFPAMPATMEADTTNRDSATPTGASGGFTDLMKGPMPLILGAVVVMSMMSNRRN